MRADIGVNSVKQQGGLAVVAPVAPATFAPSRADLAMMARAQFVAYLVEITPALAKQWLRANYDNRPMREAHIRALADEITNEHWKITHQGIAFSRTGRLIDGQHRLSAVVASGWPTYMVVFVDLDDDMFGALDRGRRRSHADDLGKDPRLVEPCSWIARLLRTTDNRVPSPAEVAEILALYGEDAADVVEVAPGARPVRSAAGIKAAVMIRLHGAAAADRALILHQWKAFHGLNIVEMDVTSGSLLQRLENIGGGGSGSASLERGVVAWIGFNPHKRELSRIIVRDIGTELAEIRSAVQRHMRDRDEKRAR